VAATPSRQHQRRRLHRRVGVTSPLAAEGGQPAKRLCRSASSPEAADCTRQRESSAQASVGTQPAVHTPARSSSLTASTQHDQQSGISEEADAAVEAYASPSVNIVPTPTSAAASLAPAGQSEAAARTLIELRLDGTAAAAAADPAGTQASRPELQLDAGSNEPSKAAAGAAVLLQPPAMDPLQAGHRRRQQQQRQQQTAPPSNSQDEVVQTPATAAAAAGNRQHPSTAQHDMLRDGITQDDVHLHIYSVRSSLYCNTLA
jgi:hypothetical protein